MLFADDILVISSTLCSAASQFVHLRLALNCFYCLTSTFYRPLSSLKSLLLPVPIFLLFSIQLLTKKLSTLHGSKAQKRASNLSSGKILKSYQTIILLLIKKTKKTTGKVNREAIENAQIICKRHAHSIRFDSIRWRWRWRWRWVFDIQLINTRDKLMKQPSTVRAERNDVVILGLKIKPCRLGVYFWQRNPLGWVYFQ